MKAAVYILLAAVLAGCTSTYLVRGEGGTPCATVARQVQSSNQARLQYSAWLSGYLTRYNYERDTKLSQNFEAGTLIDAAVQYCQGKPLDDFAEAAEAVIKELRKKQGK